MCFQEGMLRKKSSQTGAFFESSHYRWFVLRDGTIAYYR
jgi:hypothetical protein